MFQSGHHFFMRYCLMLNSPSNFEVIRSIMKVALLKIKSVSLLLFSRNIYEFCLLARPRHRWKGNIRKDLR